MARPHDWTSDMRPGLAQPPEDTHTHSCQVRGWRFYSVHYSKDPYTEYTIRPLGVSRQFCVSRVCTVRCEPVYVRFRGGRTQNKVYLLLCLACGIKPLQLNIPFYTRPRWCCAVTFHFDDVLDPHTRIWIRCQTPASPSFFKVTITHKTVKFAL